jgi:uncharacterized protein (TIGR02145 family)
LLPRAGYRSNSNTALLTNQGDDAKYWSSSPYGSSTPANSRYFSMSSSNVSAIVSSNRNYGYSVRCFKDENIVPVLEFDADGGSLS